MDLVAWSRRTSLALTVALLTFACRCSERELSRATNEDGTFDVVVFERRCRGPAPRDPNRQVAIVPPGHSPYPPDRDGLVFVMDDDNRGADVLPVETEWIASDTVRIVHDGRARIFRQMTRTLGVTVQYEVRDR